MIFLSGDDILGLNNDNLRHDVNDMEAAAHINQAVIKQQKKATKIEQICREKITMVTRKHIERTNELNGNELIKKCM
eukprot:scaffold99515_cov15-Prasinocladus_malaysianus.AAC.1